MSITKNEYIALRAALAAYFPKVEYETARVYRALDTNVTTPAIHPDHYELKFYPEFSMWLTVEQEHGEVLVIWKSEKE